MISYTHSTALMLVAILVSVVAAFTGLALTNNIVNLTESTRKTLITMSSLVIGGGIWTMHFVAMLANEFSVPVGYDVVYTLGSGLVSVLVAGVALLLLHYSTRTSGILNLAGLILGAGILSMHFIGMSAMRGVTPIYEISTLLLTGLVAALAGICAIRIAYGKRSKEHIAAGGLMLGMSVVVIHFTAMHGTHYRISSGSNIGTIEIENSTLAIVLVVAVFIICGSFLLVATTFLTTPGKRTSAELAGAQPPAQDVQAEQSSSQLEEQPALDDIRVPFERNKRIQFVASADVAAIRADGRYTQLYTRTGVCFCPWSITEAEKQLADTRFYRSHRSYLVNLQVLTSFEKRKDSGACHFEDFEALSSVPVSRTRVASLMALLGLS